MLFVGTRKTRVWAVTDRNGDGFADEVKAFAPSAQLQEPQWRVLDQRWLPDRGPSTTVC